jgi:hypothetical protein
VLDAWKWPAKQLFNYAQYSQETAVRMERNDKKFSREIGATKRK